MKNLRVVVTAHLACSALVLSGCATGGGALGGAGKSDYTTSCLIGGATVSAITALVTKDAKKTAWALAAGCAIGVGTTAIARVMDQNQQAKLEAAMQQDARRLAQEQQKYAAAQARAQSMPATTAAQVQTRDASLEKARAEYEQNFSKPVTVDIGGGGTSTITPQVPKDPPKQGQLACFDQVVLVQTARGQAKQSEKWCPNPQGQFVRAEVQPANA